MARFKTYSRNTPRELFAGGRRKKRTALREVVLATGRSKSDEAEGEQKTEKSEEDLPGAKRRQQEENPHPL